MELRIAIVEDQEPEARRLELLLRRAFQGDRPICTRFSSGDDLLARFTTGAYEVVFLDICMAGTNGIETARQLREKDPRLLVSHGNYIGAMKVLEGIYALVEIALSEDFTDRQQYSALAQMFMEEYLAKSEDFIFATGMDDVLALLTSEKP